MGTYYDRVPIIKDNFGTRNITPTECLALQGYPKSFSFPDTVPERERYKQAGNTVCVEVIERIIRGETKKIYVINKYTKGEQKNG